MGKVEARSMAGPQRSAKPRFAQPCLYLCVCLTVCTGIQTECQLGRMGRRQGSEYHLLRALADRPLAGVPRHLGLHPGRVGAGGQQADMHWDAVSVDHLGVAERCSERLELGISEMVSRRMPPASKEPGAAGGL